jgi:ferredoxin
MSVAITFDDEGHNGLVAEGTNLWAAAKRLGLRLPADCDGRGECDACAVVIVQGHDLLSPPTEAERNVLGPERLLHERLACQTLLSHTGEVIVRPAPVAAQQDDKSGYKKRFRDLPFNQQVGALIEIEATVVSEALNKIRGTYASAVEKLLNLASPQEAKKEKKD